MAQRRKSCCSCVVFAALLLLVASCSWRGAEAARALRGEPDPAPGARSMRPVLRPPEAPEVAAARVERELATLAAAVAATNWTQTLLSGYLTNDQLAAWSADYAMRCASIGRRFSIGKSVNGVDLWVVEVSASPGVVDGKPNFRYVANMHGDEPGGRMLLPMLAEWLCANAATDARASRIIQGMHLFVMPTMNPDGYKNGRRANAAGVDLNRNFPSPFSVCKGVEPETCSPSLLQTASGSQPETTAVMSWSKSTPFTASANLHEGALVANYPWDGYDSGTTSSRGVINASPDDAAFIFMSKAYASAHATMSRSTSFANGITNGAAWYPIYGSLQDWSYTAVESLEITLELSSRKKPSSTTFPALWDANRNALLTLPTTAVLAGVSGRVTSTGGVLTGATVTVTGISKVATARGATAYYNKPLAPGSYVLTARATGYTASTAAITVPTSGLGVVQNFQLTPV